MSAPEWLRTLGYDGIRNENFSLYTLKGVKAELPGAGQPKEDYIVSHGNNVIVLTIQGNLDYLRPIFDQILSTFKFKQ